MRISDWSSDVCSSDLWRTLAYFFAVVLVINIPLSSSLTWFPLALPRAFGIDPATVGIALGTAITVATLIGVFLPGIVLKLWRRPAQEKPLRAVAIFTALAAVPTLFLPFATTEIGRASCRERVCQYV